VKGVDGESFTRNGSFHFDKDGKVINADGFQLQGFQADADGRITSQMGPISIDRTVVDASATKKTQIYMNLDIRSDKNVVFDPNKPDQTSHFATGATVYDSAGSPHVVTLYFNREDDGVWKWRAMAKGEEISGGKKGQMLEQASGRLLFDGEGRLQEQITDRNSFNFAKGAKQDQKIEFYFGKDKKSGGDGVEVTQYGTASEAYKTVQDGFTGGTLAGLTFNDDGVLSAMYTNGQTVNLAQVALAKFENPEGLFKMGQNRFRESRLSGQATIGAPQAGGRGRISSKTIESSTTDIANEFINLMTSQRNFQANSRVISVSDELLQEVLNLKRT